MRSVSEAEDRKTSAWPAVGQCSERCWRRVILGLGLVAMVITQASAAQDPVLKTRPKADRDREYLASHRMTMNVQVSDATGKPVAGLEAKDFFLYDNNQLRKLIGFHEIDGQALNDATEVVILLDAVNSTAQALETEKEGIFKYLARKDGPLPYPTSFVLWFNGRLKASAPATDRNEVGRAFVSATKGVHSNACGDSAVAPVAEGGASRALVGSGTDGNATDVTHCLQVHYRDSLAALDEIARQQKTLGGRTILIWVGPGWPLLSDAEFRGGTLKERQEFLDKTVSLLTDLRDSQMTVDMIAPPDAALEAAMARVKLDALNTGTAFAQEAGPDSLALQILAHQTGGKLLNTSKDIPDDLVSCIHDADIYYALTFEMMPGRTPHEFHPLAVKVNRTGLEVRTLANYYAEP